MLKAERAVPDQQHRMVRPRWMNCEVVAVLRHVHPDQSPIASRKAQPASARIDRNASRCSGGGEDRDDLGLIADDDAETQLPRPPAPHLAHLDRLARLELPHHARVYRRTRQGAAPWNGPFILVRAVLSAAFVV